MPSPDARAMAWHIALLCLVVGALIAFGIKARAEDRPPVDVALVLAVDVSGSIKPNEAALQRLGYAAAIESPEVVKAILHGMLGAVAITYVEWADRDKQRTVIPWTVIDDPMDAAQIANRLRMEKPMEGSNTAISTALRFSAALFEIAPVAAERKVIDVSGDGPDTSGESVTLVRDEVTALGITINGLPFTFDNEYPGIADYYRTQVIGGPGAFVVEAQSIGEFERAVRMKLSSEIAGIPPVYRFAGIDP